VKISVIRGLKTWFCYRTSKKKAFMTETYHKGFLLFFSISQREMFYSVFFGFLMFYFPLVSEKSSFVFLIGRLAA
jgi:hypothetical protein